MSMDDLQQHWALLVASVIGLAVLLILVFRALLGTARARLNARVGQLRESERKAGRAGRAVIRASKKLERLRRKAQSVKPRLIDEAAGQLADAEALKKIADDQVLIAKAQVRKIILEEYPPKRQERLRQRLLPDDKPDPKPFTIES